MTRRHDHVAARSVLSVVLGVSSALGFSVVTTLPATAHAEVVLTSPEAYTQVGSPAVIAVGLSEQIVLDYSRLVLNDWSGVPMTTDPPTLDVTGTSMEAAVPLKLCPGMYKVTWHALSVDGHETDGDFPFEVTDNLTEGPPVCDQGNGGGTSAGGGAAATPTGEATTPSAVMTPEPRITTLGVDAQAPSDGSSSVVTILGWSALGAGVLAGIAALVVVVVKRRGVG